MPLPTSAMSCGGAVITNAATGAPNVLGQVYVAVGRALEGVATTAELPTCQQQRDQENGQQAAGRTP